MPTLIRLIVALLFLGGLGYAGLFALTVMVDPGEKEITVRVPQRELVANPVQLPGVNTTSPVQSNAPQPVLTSSPDDQPE